jgi:hypothetical protein
VFQVTGDAISMFKRFEENVDVTVADDFYDIYEIGRLDKSGKEKLMSAVEIEDAPKARMQRDVKENCQGWAIRVVKRLSESDVLETRWLESMTKMLERVDWNQ